MRHRRYILGIVVVVIATIALAVALSRRSSVLRITPIPSSASSADPYSNPSPVDLRNYHPVRTKIENERAALWSRYQQATNTSEKESILERAREAFVRSVSEEIFPYWYGTGWDFNGTTESPRKGKIACGYFVTTVLRDAGVKLERAKLAQQASENIVLSLTTNDHTRRFRQVPIDKFVDVVRNWGTGLYVVGLDVHVGFILNVAGQVFFIHSSYAHPYCVIRERGSESRILASSRYRVLGKLSEDDEFILKWLQGEQFTTRAS